MSSVTQLYELLERPIVTEKSTLLAQKFQQYTFQVNDRANKIELAKAFELAFPGRKVRAVRLVKVAARTRRFGKRTGHIAQRRKAIFSIVGEPLDMFAGG